MFLFGAAGEVAGFAILFYLGDVAGHGAPAFDLADVFVGNATAHVVSTIPLKPATRVVFEYPAFGLPYRKWLTGVNAEIVEAGIMAGLVLWVKFGVCEPALRKFITTITHVTPTKSS